MKSTETTGSSAPAEGTWDPMVTPAAELAAALHDHHERMTQMLGNVAEASGDDRRAVFWWLRRFLAAHEAAERVFIRSQVPAYEDEEVAAQSRLDEAALAELVAGLEDTDLDSAEFDQLLEELRRSVGRHARAEELEELPRVIDLSTPHDVERMRQALDHVDVLVSHRNGPLGERVRPFAELLASATAEFQALRAE